MTITELGQRLRLIERTREKARRVTGLRRLTSVAAATLGTMLALVLGLVPAPSDAWDLAPAVAGGLIVLKFILFAGGPSPRDIRAAAEIHQLPAMERDTPWRTAFTVAREGVGAFVGFAVIGGLWPSAVVSLLSAFVVVVLTELIETTLLLRAERSRSGTALEVPDGEATRVVLYRPDSAAAAFGR
ncbi:MAG: hypothetical protein ACEQSX_00495 [Baekduiaceae bacterium]